MNKETPHQKRWRLPYAYLTCRAWQLMQMSLEDNEAQYTAKEVDYINERAKEAKFNYDHYDEFKDVMQ